MELRLLRQGNIIGKSAAIKRVLELIDKAARSDLPVLIVGDTGTGKELVAEEIHNRSGRRLNPFVAVNMGAVTRDLAVSELFGHAKGAFTGAANNHAGRFVEAHGGTIFLDEISSADERVQISLLRALESKMIRPLGSDAEKKVDARIIAATNESLDDAADRNEFRLDLLHRLQVIRIDVPALRERREDIPLLVDYFLKFIRKEYHLEVEGISLDAMERLLAHSWPGNIRELKNTIIHAAVCQTTGTIGVDSLPDRFARPVTQYAAAQQDTTVSPNLLGANGRGGAPSRETARRGVFLPWGMKMDEVVEVYTLETLASVQRNKTEAAKRLGIARKTLYNMLRNWESSDRRLSSAANGN